MRSFEIDHTKLTPGIYYHSQSGLVITWDIRIKTPNKGDYLDPKIIHSIEHTMATYLRKRLGNYKIVGIFPMGCQTGFYVLTRFVSKKQIYEVIKDYTLDVQRTSIMPGSSIKECGNFAFHDLVGAKATMLDFYDNILRFTTKASNYKN